MSHTPFRLGCEVLFDAPPEVRARRMAAGARDEEAVPIGAAVRALDGRRVAMLAHPAAVDADLTPSIERATQWLALAAPTARLSALFGPQHGLRGEKQDNMVESEDYRDPATGLPAYSLYGTSRRLTDRMKADFDVLLVDLQDVGVRVYTFLTTLGYILEDLHDDPSREVWVLDRPNPTGRLVEGLALETGHESFVGVAPIPMQHGMTLGEFARWYRAFRRLTTALTVIPMTGYDPADPYRAWPAERVWIPPSPNMPTLGTARAYPGTVMIEGTTLSEGRGTTRPLSVLGHPEVDWDAILDRVRAVTSGATPPGGTVDSANPPEDATAGCYPRRLTFQPTFHKHAGVPVPGLDLITEGRFWNPHQFRPYRLVAAILRAIRELHPAVELWTRPPYEYEFDRTPIDVITGGTRFRQWVEDPQRPWSEIATAIATDERRWYEESRPWWLYAPR